MTLPTSTVAGAVSKKKFAILRMKKLKTFGNISASHNHNHRLNETLNADEDLTHKNIHFVECEDSVKRVHELHSLVDGKVRSNAVRANEYMLTASPEFFENKSDQEIEEWARKSFEFIEKRHTVEGVGSTVVSAVLHLDESTPHLHISVVPLYKDKNNKIKLSAKHYFDEERSPKGKKN